MALRSQVDQLFGESRGAAGSRSIMSMLREDGVAIGRFRVRSLMRELGLVCRQPGSHRYKHATVERPDIPNLLNRKFAVGRPNQVWCGDLPISGRRAVGITWPWYWIYTHAVSSAGHSPSKQMRSWLLGRSTWPMSSEEGPGWLDHYKAARPVGTVGIC